MCCCVLISRILFIGTLILFLGIFIPFHFIFFLMRFQVIDPEDMSQRARWTIIATACLLLLMCLLLVGVTLRMAPLIDDMGKSSQIAHSRKSCFFFVVFVFFSSKIFVINVVEISTIFMLSLHFIVIDLIQIYLFWLCQ